MGLIVPDDLDPGIRQELEQIISSLTALVQECEEVIRRETVCY